MELFLNILKALVIVFGIYLLYVVGMCLTFLVVLVINGRSFHLSDFGLKREQSSDGHATILGSLIFTLALAALYLPPIGQMYAMVGAAMILIGICLYGGVTFHYNIRE